MACNSKRVVKYAYLFYVMCLGILSAITTIFAAWILIELLGYGQFLSPSLVSGPVITLLIIGLIILPIIIVVGFQAFAKDQSTLAIMFWVSIILTAIGCIVLLSWSAILRIRLHDQLEVDLKKTSPLERTEAEKKEWDHLQRSLKCCGMYGVSDYTETKSVPMSCCNTIGQTCASTYDKGCLTSLSEFGRSKLLQVAIASFILAILLFVGVYAGISYSRHLSQASSQSVDTQSKERKPLRSRPLMNYD